MDSSVNVESIINKLNGINGRGKLNLILFSCLLFLILFSSSAIACLEVTLNKNKFITEEIFQAKIEIKNPVDELKREDIRFLNMRELPFKILKVNNELYFLYVNLNTIDGNYGFQVNTLCSEKGIIKTVSKTINFEVEADKIGNAYQNLIVKIIRAENFGTTEENALAILAISDYDKGLAERIIPELKKKSFENFCWPGPLPNCKTKETSLALMALNKMNENVNSRWLLGSQNTLNNGVWQVSAVSNIIENSTCRINLLSGKNETTKVDMVNGKVEKEIIFTDESKAKVTVSCDTSGKLSGKLLYTYLGKINEFSMIRSEDNKLSVEINNEKCWGSIFRGKCAFDDTTYALLTIKTLDLDAEEGKVEAWLEKNKKDLTLNHAFSVFLLSNPSDYSKSWLINNQDSSGSWKDTALASQGKEDVFSTIIATRSLKNFNDDASIVATNKAKKWLLDSQLQLTYKELASLIYFILKKEDIKQVIVADPVAIKVKENEQFTITLQNKWLTETEITLSGIYGENFILKRDETKSIQLNAKDNSILNINYRDGAYIIPIFVIKEIQGQQQVKVENIILPKLEFSQNINETLQEGESFVFTFTLKNTYNKPLKNIFLVPSQNLYEIIKINPVKIQEIKANGSAIITVKINAKKPGNYEGKIEAKDSVAAIMPVKVIVRSGIGTRTETSGQKIQEEVENVITETKVEEKEKGETESKITSEIKNKKSKTVLGYILITIAILFIIAIVYAATRKPKKKKIEYTIEKVEPRVLYRRPY